MSNLLLNNVNEIFNTKIVISERVKLLKINHDREENKSLQNRKRIHVVLIYNASVTEVPVNEHDVEMFYELKYSI